MATKTKDRSKKKPAAQIHMEKAASINADNLCVLDAATTARRLVTKCCKVTPILYLSDHGSCSKCGKYFAVHGDVISMYPKLVSRSSADRASQLKGVDYSESVVKSNREAKAPKPLKPIAGQKEFPI